jgi:hypothetical protein
MRKRGKQRKSGGEHFRSAIADWQLQLQTELKKASSLPTAMFDASDPMLEARLAESTEALFRRLLDQPMPETESNPIGDRKLEHVATEELAALIVRVAQAPTMPTELPRLEEHRDDEFLAILGDTCLRGPEPQQQRARQVLQQASGTKDTDLDSLALAIAERIVQNQDPTALDVHAIAAVCHSIAIAVLHDEGPGKQP